MRMKSSLNLSIDSQTGQRAKMWAQAHNVSLSSVVETYLQQLTHEHDSSFSERWRGHFQVKELSGTRADVLRERYSL